MWDQRDVDSKRSTMTSFPYDKRGRGASKTKPIYLFTAPFKLFFKLSEIIEKLGQDMTAFWEVVHLCKITDKWTRCRKRTSQYRKSKYMCSKLFVSTARKIYGVWICFHAPVFPYRNWGPNFRQSSVVTNSCLSQFQPLVLGGLFWWGILWILCQ